MRLNRVHMAAIAAALVGICTPEVLALQLGSRPAERWIEVLDRPDRVQALKIDDVVARLRLKPGDILADIGAGTGVFSLPLARAVAPGGMVYAVEVDQGLVDHIRDRARTEGASNIKAVLGEYEDPKLPTQDIDVAFFHDVLHHVEDRAGYLENLSRYIKPGGRIVIIERGHHRTGEHMQRAQDQVHMHMTQDQVTGWMSDVGFRLAEEYHLFDGGKWFVVYSRR